MTTTTETEYILKQVEAIKKQVGARHDVGSLRKERAEVLAVCELLAIYGPQDHPAFSSVIKQAQDAIAKAAA